MSAVKVVPFRKMELVLQIPILQGTIEKVAGDAFASKTLISLSHLSCLFDSSLTCGDQKNTIRGGPGAMWFSNPTV